MINSNWHFGRSRRPIDNRTSDKFHIGNKLHSNRIWSKRETKKTRSRQMCGCVENSKIFFGTATVSAVMTAPPKRVVVTVAPWPKSLRMLSLLPCRSIFSFFISVAKAKKKKKESFDVEICHRIDETENSHDETLIGCQNNNKTKTIHFFCVYSTGWHDAVCAVWNIVPMMSTIVGTQKKVRQNRIRIAKFRQLIKIDF